MPTQTKVKPSQDELEDAYNAPSKPHPLGAGETNVYPKKTQPITPPKEANPGYQQTGKPSKGPGEGDNEPTDNSTPKDSSGHQAQKTTPGGTEKGSSGDGQQSEIGGKNTNSSTQSSGAGGSTKGGKFQAARQWNKNRRAKGQRLGEAAKEYAKEKAKQLAWQAVKRTADAVAPGSGEIVERGGKAAIAAAKMAAGKWREGWQNLKDQVSLKSLRNTVSSWVKTATIIVVVAVTVVVIYFTLILVVIYALFSSSSGSGAATPPSTLTLSLEALPSDKASAGDKITYTIHVKSTVPTTSITVTDPVPTNTRFYPEDNTNNNIIDQNPCVIPTQDTSGKGFYCDSNKTVTWYLKGSSDASADSPFETSITVTFTVIANNTKIFNVAHADSTESTTTNTDNPYNTNLQVGP